MQRHDLNIYLNSGKSGILSIRTLQNRQHQILNFICLGFDVDFMTVKKIQVSNAICVIAEESEQELSISNRYYRKLSDVDTKTFDRLDASSLRLLDYVIIN